MRAHFYKIVQSLLDDHTIDRNEPCTVLVARTLARAADLESTHNPDSEWWKDAMVIDPSKPYSSVKAAGEVARRVTGRSPGAAALEYEDGLTWRRLRNHLDPNTWYAVQGWRTNGTGHNFMLLTGPNPRTCHILQSSTTKGLRVNDQMWTPLFADKPTMAESALTWERLAQYQRGIALVELW